MLNQKSVLVVVPARGGSKGVKLKNLRPLGGVPLVALVGRIVQQLEWVDRAVVSTDHDEIARIAAAAGLAAPFRRPESLAGDRIGDLEVLTHALEECEKRDGRRYDIIVMLQPTSPFRLPRHVTATVEKLLAGGYDAVWTLSPTDSKAHPLKQLLLDGEKMTYYDPAGAGIIARQQLQPVYHRNGVAYAIRRTCLLDKKSIMGDNAAGLVIEDPLVNIDTEEDLLWAQFLLDRGRPELEPFFKTSTPAVS